MLVKHPVNLGRWFFLSWAEGAKNSSQGWEGYFRGKNVGSIEASELGISRVPGEG